MDHVSKLSKCYEMPSTNEIADLQNKLASVLIRLNNKSPDKAHNDLIASISLPASERLQFFVDNYGENIIGRVEQILLQLADAEVRAAQQ